MDEKKYKRLQYLAKNADYLSIRERQEYDELLNEYSRNGGEVEPEPAPASPAEDFYAQDDALQQKMAAKSSVPDFSRSTAAPLAGKNKKVKKPKKKRKWLRWVLLALVLLIAGMAGFFAYGYSRGVKHEGGVVKAEKFDGQANSDGSTNILLLGADQRPGQSSSVAHSDSIMVLHLGKGGPKLVSFMRDTLVDVPGVNADGGNEVNYKINAAFTIGEQNHAQGAELMRQTLQQNFGINIKYYAIVDFSSFATIIDSLFPGGVKIDAKFGTVNGQNLDEIPVPDDLATTEGTTKNDVTLSTDQAAEYGYEDSPGIYEMIKPGEQKMNGRTLLNYARFRHDDNGDAGRVQRQQQVMGTLMSKVKNPLALFTGASAFGTARAITMTNIPNSFLLTKALPAMLDMGKLQSTTIPAENDWQDGYDIDGGSGLLIDFNKYKPLAQQLLGQ